MEEKLNKIKKLLRLSTSSNEHEAKSALMHAQKLALQAGIELETISYQDTERDVIDNEINLNCKRVPIYLKYIAVVMRKNFRVRLYLTYRYKKVAINVIGYPEDVEIFKEVFFYTVEFFKRSWKEFWKLNKTSEYSATHVKNRYLFAFCDGLEIAFQKNVEEYGLVPVNPKADDYISQKDMPTQKDRVPKVADSYEAESAGYRDGKAAAGNKRIDSSESVSAEA